MKQDTLDGKGREIDNIKGATGLGLIDIDGLDELELEAVFSKASLASYSCCIYRTISGHGLRIFFKYKRPDDCKLSMIDLYELSLNKAINFYEMLLGKEADRKCTDFTAFRGWLMMRRRSSTGMLLPSVSLTGISTTLN